MTSVRRVDPARQIARPVVTRTPTPARMLVARRGPRHGPRSRKLPGPDRHLGDATRRAARVVVGRRVFVGERRVRRSIAIPLIPRSASGHPATGSLLVVYVPSKYNAGMSPVQGRRGRGRINIRVDPEQEARLRAAAEANGETLTGFLLAAAADRAEEVFQRASRVALSTAAFERFVAALDAPVEPMPTLQRYAKKPSPIPPR